MSYCSNCGAKLEDGDLFCENCGEKQTEMQPMQEVTASDMAAPEKRLQSVVLLQRNVWRQL